jgi:hypothetical protein
MKDEGTLPLLGLVTEVDEQMFRVVRMAPGKYGVVRMSDNVRAGTFIHAEGSLQLSAENIDVAVLAEIAAVAIRKGI